MSRALDQFAVEDRSPKPEPPLLAGESPTFARSFSEDALEHQELNGSIVAVLLAVAVIGYGGFLAVFWGMRADARVARVTATQQAEAAPAVVSTIATNIERRTGLTPTARTLTALWQRRDTRSLDRAFATLRRDTLAFRSCGMRMTDVDRAVARCEGIVTTLAADGAPSSRSATWTIDFQRTSGRWLIARVSTR